MVSCFVFFFVLAAVNIEELRVSFSASSFFLRCCNMYQESCISNTTFISMKMFYIYLNSKQQRKPFPRDQRASVRSYIYKCKNVKIHWSIVKNKEETIYIMWWIKHRRKKSAIHSRYILAYIKVDQQHSN